MPKKGMSHRILLSLPNELFDLVDGIADGLGMPVATFLRTWMLESQPSLIEMAKAVQEMKEASSKKDALLAFTARLSGIHAHGQLHIVDSLDLVREIDPGEANPFKESSSKTTQKDKPSKLKPKK